MELISREEVEKLIDKYIEKHDTKKKPLFTAFSYAIDMLPTIESRPKGKWTEYRDDYHGGLMGRCSVCNKGTLYAVSYDLKGNRYTMNYCPNCGADMRGKE